MTDLTEFELHELAGLVAAGTVSPVDIVTAFLDRIDAHGAATNAYVHVDRAQALAAARRAPIRGDPFASRPPAAA